MQHEETPAGIDELRGKLKAHPENWEWRLQLAARLAEAGQGQQAAMLISTAPAEPVAAEHLVEAARFVMVLDDRLALRYADAALAHNESDVEAALLRARIHQKRGESKDAYRFALVAGALDPQRCLQEAGLLAWLAGEGLVVPVTTDAEAAAPLPIKPADKARPPMQRARPSQVAAASMAGNPAPLSPEPHPAPGDREEDEDAVAVAMVIEDDQPPAPADVPPPAGDAKSRLQPVPLPGGSDKGADIEWLAGASDEAPGISGPSLLPAPSLAEPAASPPPPPARKRLTAQKVSAAVVAVAVHVALIALLAFLVVIVPAPKMAELVGVVAPEMSQDQPQTKQVMPTAMPSAAPVAAAPARALTAAGISSVSLPDFDAKTEGPMVTEIATTDLGASFAMPFSPKGTSKVNFFGIKSQGRRVAFLIDAERYMLTDPRGGYPAYEIVKDEIAKMIGALGLETHFNVLLYEGRDLSAFSEKLVPATTANKEKVRDWLYPVNRQFEKLGIRPIGYPVLQVQTEVEPVPSQHLTGYLRAIQYALETDVDAVFIIASGWRSMEIPRTKEEIEKIKKDMRWTEKDEQAWRAAQAKGREWLAKENAARKAKGIPQRVVVSMGEIWRDMGLRPPRSPPGGIQVTAEEREDQVKNAIRIHYSAKGKVKPQINFVIFIGKDQNEKTVPRLEHFENIAQRARSGKVRVLQGLAALKNVTSGG